LKGNRIYAEMLVDEARYQRLEERAVFRQDEGASFIGPIKFEAGRKRGDPYLAYWCIWSDDEFRWRLVKNNVEHTILFLGLEVAVLFSVD